MPARRAPIKAGLDPGGWEQRAGRIFNLGFSDRGLPMQRQFVSQIQGRVHDTVLPVVEKVFVVLSPLFILALTCLFQAVIAHAQALSLKGDVDRPHGDSITDPCLDRSTDEALRDALRLVCLKGPVDAANRSVRKAIIIGFVGGFVRRDDEKHPEVLFASYLHSRYGSAIHAEVFGNHEGKRAVQRTIEWLDSDRDGSLTAPEKETEKIIVYGHSWGASQTLAFARELARRGIPVALTIQIDSIRKLGQNDRNIPPNVAKAVNFYQRKGVTRGQSLIVPVDAERTKILGNFHMTYEHHQIKCDNYPWLPRVLNKPHHEIENDPHIWDEIASLIASELSRTDANHVETATPSESSAVQETSEKLDR